MTFSRWTGSSWTPITIFRRWTGSVWQAIAQGQRWTGSSWSIFGFLQASLSPTSVNGTRTTAGTCLSSSCTTTAVNGSGSYTYHWNVTTSSGNTISAVSPTAATTVFSASVNNVNIESTGSATCTVTDSVSGNVVTTSNSVSIDLTYSGP